MKIAVVTPFFPTKASPQNGRPTYEIVKRLGSLAEVHVICAVPRYPPWFHPKTFEYARVDRSYCVPGINLEYGEYPAIPMLSRLTNGLMCARALRPVVSRVAPDILLNYMLYPAGYAALRVGRELHIPTVVGAIGSDLNAIADPVTRCFTKRTVRSAEGVLCKSRALAESATRLGAKPDNVHVITNGCDGATFARRDRRQLRSEMSLNRGERVLLFVGRLEVTKGLRELLEAVSRLSKTRQNIRLVLLGGGLAKETLRRTLAELALERVVQFVPVSPPRDVARWMAASDLLVLPSYAEGCPNVVVEALNCGCPVVATDVGGIPDLVPDECGILVPPRDADRLTLALEIALERKWDQDRIASSARRSWEDVAREIYQLCSSLMPQQSRTSAQARKASFAR